MLGLSNPERVLRRSRSMNLPLQSPPATSAGQVTLHPPILHPEFVAASRRSSLPPDSTLAETYNAMTADVSVPPSALVACFFDFFHAATRCACYPRNAILDRSTVILHYLICYLSM